MTSRITMSFASIGGTAAGLGRSASGKTLVADRRDGVAGGMGLGFNGGELLAAALGGCFWNDLHHVAEAEAVSGLRVDAVEAAIDLAGQPPRVVRAHIAARLSGADDATLARIFDAACAASTIANSLSPAFLVEFERLPRGDTP